MTVPSTINDKISAINARLFDIIRKMPYEEKCELCEDLENRLGLKKRKHDRKECYVCMESTVRDHFYKGFIKNISSSGVFVEIPKDVLRRVHEGEQIMLTFVHPDDGFHAKKTGKIARIGQTGLGVAFV